MLTVERVALESVDWARLDSFADRTVFQTRPWLEFIARTQRAQPLVAAVHDRARVVGYFTGALFRRFGCTILGSPFPGWTTSYMGFNLDPCVARPDAVAGLARYAFGDLRCLHVELMDRRLTVSDCEGLGFTHRDFPGFEIDLTQSDDALLSSMTKDRRRCLRRARDNGLVVEEAHDVEFADDYYDQLTEVFGRQKLVPTYSRERLRTLIRCVHPSGTLLLLRAREPGGRSIATGVFPAMNDTMYFWGGASWRASRHLHPNELIQWHAMTYWRSRGIRRYDMGGGGDYKRQYGGREIHVPFFRKSRYPVIACLRTAAQRAARLSQRLGGVGGHPGAMRVCS